MLGEKVTGNIAAEHLGTISGQHREGEPDAFAISGGVEYLPKEDLKVTTRLEYRNEDSEASRDSYLAELGMGYKLTPEYSLLFKERYFWEDIQNNGDRVISRTQLGIAYRPLVCDRLNVLGKFEFKHQKDSTVVSDYLTDAYITSVEGHYQVGKSLQLIGKYAGKLVSDDGFESYTDLLSGRIVYDVTERFDLGLEYRILTGYDTESRYQGGSAEIGYRLIENLWLSLGYSFDNFDADLTGDSYQGKGPYLKIRFKFDETLFKRFESKAEVQ